VKIAILNGEPEAGTKFDLWLQNVTAEARSAEHEVELLPLRELDLKGCSGCFGCWVKTPGECVKRDGSAVVCRAVLDADLLVLASPMVMGFTTALLKRAADQMIPILHPYLVIEGGELHHRARYERYPLMALLLGPEPGGDAEDIDITEHMWARMARNMKSRLVFTAAAGRIPSEVAHGFAAAA
jgi:multimeric flavodoxin WrbA